MNRQPLPTPLARIALRYMPASLLQKSIDVLMRSMQHSHHTLFRNLARLKPATIIIEATDLPHCFSLSYGGEESVVLSLAASHDVKGTARLKGSLDVLLNMLEGRIDGDMLFFSRELEIAGDTAAVVALRNTLDREEIDLLTDVSAVFGPFAKPLRKAVVVIDGVARGLRHRVEEIVEEKKGGNGRAEALAQENDTLRGEMQTLKKHIATLEVHRKRTEAKAS